MHVESLSPENQAKKLESCPTLGEGLPFYVIAYHELRFDRPVGFGVGPIPWTSISRWAEINYVEDADDLANLVYVIRQIEEALDGFNKDKEDRANKRKARKKGSD